MKNIMTSDFDSSLIIKAPKEITLWKCSGQVWFSKEWNTGPCKCHDDPYFTYDTDSRLLSFYNTAKGELKKKWVLPRGTEVTYDQDW